MKYAALTLSLFIISCSGGAPAPAADTVQKGTQMTNCLLHSPKDIQMWINAMPGAGTNPTLIGQFKITAPTPGYSFELKVLEVQESFPPRYVFDLVATPPNGIVTEVETETDVRVEIPNFEYSEIASATVECSGETLFSLDEVETAY